MMPMLRHVSWAAVMLALGLGLLPQVLLAQEVIRLGLAVRPVGYRLALDIDPFAPEFSGTASIDLDIATPTDRVVLHADRLSLDAIEITQGPVTQVLAAERLADDGTVALVAAKPLSVGAATLTIRYRASFASGLEGLYRVDDDGAFYAFTQFEAIGARRAFPCFDEPGFKAPFTISLTVPLGMVAIAGTRESAVDAPKAGRVTHHFAASRPLPSYLVAFAVGDFDVVDAPAVPPSAMRPNAIPLRGIAAKGKGKELSFALDATAPLLTKLEDWFGIAYPFDKLDVIAVPDFGAGGMENAGTIMYDENLVLLDIDATLARQREFVTTHAHELTHQWFGNLATPRWWDDLWLNEAVATFMESKLATWWKPDWHFETDRQLAAAEAMEIDLLPSARRVHEPVTTIGGISAAFDAITYQKGAALIGMAENTMGEYWFRDFLHGFLTRHAFAGMDGADFIHEMAASPAGADAARMLQSYLDQRGVPQVEVARDCANDHGTLMLRQRRLSPLNVSSAAPGSEATWVTRICLDALRGERARGACLLMDQRELRLPAGTALCQVEHLAAGRSPGYYALSFSNTDRRALVAALPKLGRAEALAVALDLETGLQSGNLSLAEYLAYVRAMVSHPDNDVRAFPFERLKALVSDAANELRRTALRKFVHALYRPQLDAIGLLRPLSGKEPATWVLQLYREQLVELFVETNADADLAVELAAIGQRIVADGETDLDETLLAPPDVVGPALVSAARLGDTGFLEQLVARLEETDVGHDRSLWLGAIAASHAPESSATIERLVSSPSLRGEDVLSLLFDRASEAPYRAATWALVERLMPVLLRRLDGDLDLSLVQVADGFCSDAQAEKVDLAMRPMRERIRGGAIQLAQTLDRIRACAALAVKLGQEPLPADLATQGR